MNQSRTTHPAIFLVKTLSGIGRWADSRLDAILADQGLSIAKLSLLRELCDASEPVALGQLAERLDCAKSNVTQLVDRLEHEGLVRRVPHPDDRRCIRATVTEEGRRRCDWGKHAEATVEQQLFGNLSRVEKEQLMSLLQQIRPAERSNEESQRMAL